MIDRTATARLQRLVRWLEHSTPCFGHRAHVVSLRQYVQGVFSRAERKSMQAILAGVTEPTSYHDFQPFITHAPWDAAAVWRRLRAVIPERTGVAVLDGMTVPKHGTASVGVARRPRVSSSSRHPVSSTRCSTARSSGRSRCWHLDGHDDRCHWTRRSRSA